jgi:hypothetical protein
MAIRSGFGGVAGGQGVAGEPVEVLAPVAGVEGSQLVDERLCDRRRIVVLRRGEPAAGRLEVLQHHDERAVGRVVGRVPDARRPHGQLATDRRVELGLRHAEADHPEEGLLLGVYAARS